MILSAFENRLRAGLF